MGSILWPVPLPCHSQEQYRRRRETVNRLTDILVTMNTAADCGKLFKIVQMLYGLLGLRFSEEATVMGLHPEAMQYFLFSFVADFGEIMQEYKSEEK